MYLTWRHEALECARFFVSLQRELPGFVNVGQGKREKQGTGRGSGADRSTTFLSPGARGVLISVGEGRGKEGKGKKGGSVGALNA